MRQRLHIWLRLVFILILFLRFYVTLFLLTYFLSTQLVKFYERIVQLFNKDKFLYCIVKVVRVLLKYKNVVIISFLRDIYSNYSTVNGLYFLYKEVR
jgi:hypothetical protein